MADLSQPAQAFLDRQAKPQLSDAAQIYLNRQREKESAALTYASKFDPEAYAASLRKSKESGLPVDVVQRNPQDAEEIIRAAKMRLQELNKSGVLKQMMSNHDFAAVAQDDLPHLAKTEGFWTRNFGNPAARGVENLKSTMAMNVAAKALDQIDRFEQAYQSTDLPERERQIALIRREAIRSPGPDTPMILRYFDGSPEDRQQIKADLEAQASRSLVDVSDAIQAAKAIPQNTQLQAAMQGDWADLLSAVIKNPEIILQVGTESLVQTLPGMLAAPFTAGASMGLNSYLMERGSKMQEILQESGVDVTDPAAVLAALRDPAKREQIEGRANLKAIPVALFDTLSIGLAGVKVVPRTMTGAKAKIAEVAAQTGIQGAAGGAGEALGQLAADGEINSAEVMLEVIAEAYGAIPEFATMSGGRLATEYKAYKNGKKSAELLAALADSAEASKLAQRSPEAFASYINALGEATGNDTAYIDVRAFNGFFQSQNVDPQDAAEQLGVLKPYVEAANAGGDLPIKLGDLLAQVAKKKELKSLLEHVRLKPGDLSAAEAVLWVSSQQNRMQADAETLLSEMEDREAFEQSADAVEDAVFQQLMATGKMTEQTARANAGLHRAFAITQASRLGITPEELYQRFGVKVVAGEQSTVKVSLSQVDFPNEEGRDSYGSPGAQVRPLGETPITDLQSFIRRKLVSVKNSDSDSETLDQSSRGAIDLSNFPNQATIALFEDADLSTFLHESGHFFFEVLGRLAKENEQAAADMAVLLKFVGHKGTLDEWLALSIDERRAGHEKVAEGFEAYLFEGKAPTPELQGLFNRFRSWLVHVYKALTNMRVKLNDDVRSVFDRLLSTDEAIARAQQQYDAEPVFGTAKQAGMTEGEFNAYRTRAEKSKQEAIDAGLAMAMRDIKRIINADRKEIREAVEAEVMARPEYQARWFFSRGRLPDGSMPEGMDEPVKLSKLAIEDAYGEGAADILRELQGTGKYGLYTAGDGMAPDVAAPLFGYRSGDELIQAMVQAGDPKVEIERQVNERLRQMYGELDAPGAIEALAEKIVHNSISLDVLAQEQRALALQHNAMPMDMKGARAYAAQVIAGKRIRDIRPSVYAQMAAKAGRMAAQALRATGTQYRQEVETKQSGKAGPQKFRNNVEEAAYWKRQQILNELLFREATKAREEADKIAAYMKKQAKPAAQARLAKAGHTYLDQVNAVLEMYEFRKASNKTIDRRVSLRAFVAGLDEDQLGMLAIPDEVLDNAKVINYRELTVEELLGAHDAVKSLVHLANFKNKLLNKKLALELDEARQRLAESIVTNANRVQQRTIEKHLPAEKAKAFVAGYLYSHRRLSSLVHEMDGGKDRGAMWQMIMQPLNEAGDNEAQLIAEMNQQLVQIYKRFDPKTLRSMYVKRKIPGTNLSLTRQAILSMALNSGTEDNRTKMLAGLAAEGITEQDVAAALDTLTQEDWQFVTSIWQLINDMWPEIKAKEERVNGVAPEKVEGIPVHTKFGTFMGQYYPLVYDDIRTQRDISVDAAKDMMRGAFTAATTRRGHTKKRVEGVQRLIRLDLGVIEQHLNQVIHDLTHHEVLLDTARLLKSERVTKAIIDHYGQAAYQTIKAAVDDIAAGQVPAQLAYEKGLQWLRNGSTVVGMGWNVGTALLQPLGFTNSIVRIGAKWVGVGISRMLGSPGQMQRTVDSIKGRSKFMAERFNTQSREIADIRNKIKGSRLPALEESFFWMITRAQMLVDVPTWIGGYERALSEGATETDAIAFADQAVIDSQGGGQIKDLAQIQRGHPLTKLFTNFMSYFVTTYNLMAQRYRATRMRNPAEVMALAGDFFLLYVMPCVLGYALSGALKGFDDDDLEDLPATLAKEQLSFLLGGFFGLRELGSAVRGYDYKGPAGTRFFVEASKLIEQAAQGEADAALLKAANNTAGILFHYPAGQVQRTVEGGIGLIEGDSVNPLTLATGPRRE